MAKSLPDDLESLLGTLCRALAQDGDARSVAVLALSKATVKQTDYDRWDGGQYGYTVYLEVE